MLIKYVRGDLSSSVRIRSSCGGTPWERAGVGRSGGRGVPPPVSDCDLETKHVCDSVNKCLQKPIPSPGTYFMSTVPPVMELFKELNFHVCGGATSPEL